MGVNGRSATRRTAPLVDSEQILRRRYGGQWSDFGDLIATWCPLALWTKSEEPDLARRFGNQAMGTRGRLRLCHRGEDLDPPKKRAGRQFRHRPLGYGLADDRRLLRDGCW